TYIQAPASIFRQIKKLEPGCQLLINDGKVEMKKWYSIPFQAASENTGGGYDAAQNRLRELLSASVKRRLISDVPLGAFLSGGIDSSVIVALASQETPHLNTFSIGYADEPFFDETRYATLVAEK